MATTSIALKALSKTFVRRSGEEVRAIDDISLDVETGEFLVLLGPSGCGKTTLLRSVAGLEEPTSGQILIDGQSAYDSSRGVNVPPESRNMGMIFQSYALWPHMTVHKNVAYPLKNQRQSRAAVDAAVRTTLGMVGIPELADQYPGQISGGQQQRVALSRALVAGSSVVLFDEPLSNVDAKVREQLRLEIKRMHLDLGFTAVYVTHDQEEAMALATRIAVVHAGRIEQLGTPEEIYHTPSSLLVGRFIGHLNELPGRVLSADGQGCVAETAIGPVHTGAVAGAANGDEVVLGIRPDDIVIVDASGVDGVPNGWAGSVDLPVFLGARNEYMLTIKGVELKVSSRGQVLDQGASLGVTVDPARVHVFRADTGERR